MIIISHRGNIDGPNPKTENTVFQTMAAWFMGFDVEVDIWRVDGIFYLGHDAPTERVYILIHEMPRFWFHCKNIEAIRYFLGTLGANYFFHITDDVALTGSNYLWTYPGKEITDRSIAVLPESVPEWDIKKAFGVCTDYPKRYL